MSQKVAIVVLGVLLISMVTGAPTASRVDTESVDESESAVDRGEWTVDKGGEWNLSGLWTV